MRHEHLELREQVNQLLEHLGREAGLPLALNEDGMVAIELPDEVVCTLEVPDDFDHVLVHTPVASVPPGDTTDLLERALARNLFGLSMPAAWLAWEASTRTILLCAAFTCAEQDTDFLHRLLEDVHAEVLDSRLALQRRPQDEGRPNATAAMPPDAIMLRI